MAGHDIIVIGASAGGVESLVRVVARLPKDIPAAVFVVMHFPAQATSVLPQILSRARTLPAVHAVDGDRIRHGQIFVAPPDHHLIIERDRMRVTRGPREHGHRPAVDPTMRSAAIAYGPRVVGVVITGTLDDGTEGLLQVKARRGITVVQDPNDAIFSGMPQSALENVEIDHVVPLAELPELITRLAHAEIPDGNGGSAIVRSIGEDSAPSLVDPRVDGVPSVYSCPECHGTLFEAPEGELLRFRCRVGHAYSADTLVSEQGTALEAALWTALRSLEESSSLSRRLAERAEERGQRYAVKRFLAQVEDTDARAEIIRQVLRTRAGAPIPDASGEQTGTSG
jgi:two-component system, chemotaxis family, protein-glutamate methylesterase/glutaminase